MEAPAIALTRPAAAPLGAIVVFLLFGAATSAQTSKAPPATGIRANEGYRSVAERAERDWYDSHTMFTKEMTRAENACAPALKQSVQSVKGALAERTRAWTEFYTQQGRAADDYRKAAAASELQEQASARAAETEIAELTKLIEALKERNAALVAGGTNGLDEEALARAIRDNDQLVTLREQTINALRDSVEIAKRTVDSAQAVQAQHGNAAQTAAAFGELIRAQDKLYASLYRSRELRLSLDCGPIIIDPPSTKLPALN